MSATEEATTITPPVKYSVTDANIQELKEKYSGLTANTNGGYQEVKEALREVVSLRTSTEKARKAFKKDALEYGRRIDDEAKRVTALLLEVEEPLKAEKQKVDNEKARIKAEKEAVEAKRVADIRDKIQSIMLLADGCVNDTSLESLQEKYSKAECLVVDETEYEEFTEEAKADVDNVRACLFDAMEKRKAFIEEEAKQKAEADRLSAERKAFEDDRAKVKAEQEAMAKIAQDKIDTERKAFEDDRAKVKADQKAKAKVEQDKIDAERKELKAEKDAMRAEQNAKDEAERKESMKKKAIEEGLRIAKEIEDRKEAERKEEEKRLARIAELAPDREKLTVFADKVDAVLKERPVIVSNNLCACLSECINIMSDQVEYIRGM